MATSNRIRALNRLPFDFQDGLTITGQASIFMTGATGLLGAINNGEYSPVSIDTAAALRISGTYFTD